MNTLKTIRNTACVLLASILITGVVFAESASKIVTGPKGGRMLTKAAPHAEFFVEKDRKVTVAFYGADLKPTAPGERVVTVIAEAKTGKVKIDMEKKPEGFVSKQPLPEGNKYQVVVQVRDKADATPNNYRILFNDEVCAECKHAEYACTCDESGH